MSYTHLTEAERYQIFALQKAGHAVRAIAAQLARHRSSIYRELKRNLIFDARVVGYSPSRAQSLCRWRRIVKARRQRISPQCWQAVWQHLALGWSPQQIAGRAQHEGAARISHESIYRRIWADKKAGGRLYEHLRLRLRRGRRYRRHASRGQIAGRVGIELRPQIVERRTRLGDWELDTLFGQGSKAALVSCVERRSKYLTLEKVPNKQALAVAYAVARPLKKLGKRVYTLTSDNGKEFSLHSEIARVLKAKFFFARPYAAWQRGTNENTNGLLRQYFPKDRNFSTITAQEIEQTMHALNHRPRKTLGYLTPHEVFFSTKFVALKS